MIILHFRKDLCKVETGSAVNQLCRADTSEVQTYQAKAWITLSIGYITRLWICVRETSG